MPAIPPIRIEPLHRSLKHPFPRPRGGVTPVLLLGLLGLVALGLYEMYHPRAPRKKVTRPMLSAMVANKPGTDRLSEYEKHLKEELRKYQEEQARLRQLIRAAKPAPVRIHQLASRLPRAEKQGASTMEDIELQQTILGGAGDHGQAQG